MKLCSESVCMKTTWDERKWKRIYYLAEWEFWVREWPERGMEERDLKKGRGEFLREKEWTESVYLPSVCWTGQSTFYVSAVQRLRVGDFKQSFQLPKGIRRYSSVQQGNVPDTKTKKSRVGNLCTSRRDEIALFWLTRHQYLQEPAQKNI